MATIEFKGKPETIYNVDDTIAYQWIKIPTLNKKHCDMAAFRFHPTYGSYANSDLFDNVLERIKRNIFKASTHIRLDRALPQGVTVTPGAFLFTVTIDV